MVLGVLAFCTTPLILLFAMLIVPLPIAEESSIADMGTGAYDKIFLMVLPVTETAFVPCTSIPFTYTVLVMAVYGGLPVKVPAAPMVLFDMVTPVELVVAAPIKLMALAQELMEQLSMSNVLMVEPAGIVLAETEFSANGSAVVVAPPLPPA